ncbi:EAL domain-containing protein [Rhodoplanes sp. TEM]|uniref:EAL domain-containing protein n=1 Tax=Rhodoplanes tepidamans TaxID=200616 RepID=A0ABT5JET3_RHOTP|nr:MULTISPECIES: EAL domain-containing protein [Rhodoplanes]MDC7788047.1 EAL domain-containing protein [Rhodoplanes tepidamans]MDC7987542.1 EAL domain-containing protein [Rhodoplanes sp. TEM]MDQ0353964.1 diguanylate cyclase (GGDEF)-like protein/PAS domain S-box-containing protein [Rhodoplanes tepidamans]
MRDLRAALAALVLVGCALLGVVPAHAVQAVSVRPDVPAIDLTDAVERQQTDGDRVQVSTAPGPDGIVRRVEVRSREGGSNWAVLALANTSDEQFDRLIVVPHYQMVGSGLLWPDLGLSRVVTVTPSVGDRPDRQDSATADIFRVTLDPGAVVTYVIELRTDRLPQIYLWEPEAYKDKINSFTLYHGMVIGIAGLLALFLTILFVVKGSVMFPAAAALAWAVLVYIGVDFGFWGKVFDMSAGAERVWRACGEAILAATLVVFLFAYLNLSRWHVRYAHVTIGWLAVLAALIAVALWDPAIASGVARLSLLMVATLGLGLVLYLSTHGFDRAVLLIPTWLLLVVWVLAAGMTVSGAVTNDIVGPALLGGLVLIVMLIGFTVMQHAFAGGVTQGIVSDVERRALALTGAGDLIWDWDVATDKVYTSPETEQALGLKRGTLDGPAAQWLEVLHQLDRDRFRAALDSAVEQRRGRLVQDFRLRTSDGHYLWFTLKARPVVGSDGEVVRLVGTLTDVTEFKTAEERLLHDAVHDNLTGLPNRQLFLDRLQGVFAFAKADPAIRPTVMVIDLDRFKQVNDSVGMAVGDSILLTLARRLGRLLKPQDTLARLAGDQFGLILLSERESGRVIGFAETMRKTINAPITFNDREIILTASIGLALYDAQAPRPDEVLKDAELAMYHGKRIGGDRIDIYKPAMRARKTDRLTLESELRRALEREEITLLYQPIVRLEDRSVAGFEALARWDHPKMGRLSPSEFISIAEEIGLIVDLGLFALERTARQLAIWQRAVPTRVPLFASVNVSSRQLLRHDLIHDLRTVMARSGLMRGSLKLEMTESLVMENPELAAQILHRIKELGAGLALDDFGTGHSSLAYLQRFPFDTIKIDKSFVRTTAKGTRPVLLRSIIGLAHDLGMEVVAEGAETDSDAVELYQLGCEYVQGYVFGEPMPAEAARELLIGDRLALARG